MSVSPSDEPIHPTLATPGFAQSPEQRSSVLQGPLGLRAGWAILLYLVLAVVFGVILFVLLFKGTGQLKGFQQEGRAAQKAALEAKRTHQRPVPMEAPLSYTALMEGAETGAVVLAALAVGFMERRRFRVYGLGARYLRDAVPGALWGIAAISLLVGVLRGLHLLTFDRRLIGGGAAWKYGVAWLLTFLMVGVFEEFLFRGYIQYALMRGVLGLGRRIAPDDPKRGAFWIAAVLLSAGFACAHLANAGEDPVGIAVVFLAGMLFSYALWRTGSLWWGIGFHMTWDWGQSFLFGVPDSGNLSAGRLFATHASGNALLSGGVDGPEGSVFVIPVLLLVGVVLKMHARRELPPLEPESLPSAATGVAATSIP